MKSQRLNHILEYPDIWIKKIPAQLRAISKDLHDTKYWWWNTQSRTLASVLNSTFGNYCNGSPNAYKIMHTMCALTLGHNNSFNIYPKYKLITSEMATNLENDLINTLEFPEVQSQEFGLILYHIPKGKTYLNAALEKKQLTRLRTIEILCIENPSHFLRIYRNFNNTGNNIITVFSDTYTENMINTLWVMLPHLMEIVPHETSEDAPLTENDIEYNTKVDLLYKFFNELYEIMKNDTNTVYTTEEITEDQNKFQKITTEFIKHINTTTQSLQTFATNLANAKNNNTNQYLTTELHNINRRITCCEEDLRNYYITKSQLERQLTASKLISAEDVKPFIDTIQNTKAIEILYTNPTTLSLRITAPVQYFQENDLIAYEQNSSSNYNIALANDPLLKNILHKIFVTREYKLLLQAIINIGIENQYETEPLKLKIAQQPDEYTQFPNPHLFHFNCWSAAKSEIQKNMCKGNYELVIMQMVAAVQTINIAENASFINRFLGDILHTNNLKKLLTIVVNTPEGEIQYNYDQIIEHEQKLQNQENNTPQTETNTDAKQPYSQIEIPDDDSNWETPINIEGENNEEN